MPVLKHAKKALKQQKKRALANKKVRILFRDLIKKAKANPTPDAVSAAFKSIDKAAKNNILHKNKAARMKSSLSKVTNGNNTTAKKTTAKKTTAKKSVKRSSAKKK